MMNTPGAKDEQRGQVLILSNDPAVATMIARTFRWTAYRVDMAGNEALALEAVRALGPDLIILDVPVVNPGGVTTLREFRTRAEFAAIAIIVVSDRRNSLLLEECYKAGCDDYLIVPMAVEELPLRAEAVLRRVRRQSAPQTADHLTVGAMTLDPGRLLLTCPGGTVRLTPVERDLLRCLMSRPEQIFPIEALLQEVWHYFPGTGDPALVRVHVHNLRRKVSAELSEEIYGPFPSIIRTVAHRGYSICSVSA